MLRWGFEIPFSMQANRKSARTKNQKTKGLSRKAEKNTNLSLEDWKGGIFRTVKCSNASFAFGIKL